MLECGWSTTRGKGAMSHSMAQLGKGKRLTLQDIELFQRSGGQSLVGRCQSIGGWGEREGSEGGGKKE